MIEEDEKLCKHEWSDLYGGEGVAKNDRTIALNAFYCKFCLEIRVKSYSLSRFHMKPETFDED